MGRYIVAGNWKMNKLPSETYDFVKSVAEATQNAGCEVVCCTPYVCLCEAVRAASGTHVKIGAENLHFEDKGRARDDRFAGKEMQRPFYDCLKMLADKELSQDEDAKIVRATKSMCSEIRASLVVANFWEKPSEVKKLRDKIAFGVRLGLRGIVADDLNAAEKVMNICKCSYGEILRHIDEMA